MGEIAEQVKLSLEKVKTLITKVIKEIE